MADNEEKKPARKTSGSRVPILALVVFLVIAALTVGVGLSTANGNNYGCMSVTQNGSTVKVVTTGIIHFSGSQYYITCGEGGTLPTTPLSVSCLTVTPKLVTNTYPAGQAARWYYLSAPGHEIVAPPPSTNSSVVLQPTDATIQVSC